MTNEALRSGSRPHSISKLLLGAAVVLAIGAASYPKLSHAAGASHDAGQSASQQVAVADGDPYEVKTEVIGECKVGAECTARIRIESKGEFHVNESYPFKFTATSDKAELHGSAGNVFTSGDFERQGKTVGVMTVKFKPKEKGPITITGKYKICVCSEKICSPQTIDVSIPVNVK